MLGRNALVLISLAACGGSGKPPVADAQPATDDGPTSTPDTPATSRDPATDGDATVTTQTASIPGSATGRTVPATIFTPSTPGPHAAVIVSPGFQMDRAQYTSYAHHLATWGFVVVLADYADRSFFADHEKLAADLTAVIDWTLAQQALAVDPTKIATAGHSLGGKLSVFAAAQDPRVKAVVAWDPVDGGTPSIVPEKMSTLHAALAVVGETTDGSGGGMPCAPTADNFQVFYAASASPSLQLTVNGADHMDWVDDPSCSFCGFCAPGSAAPELARTATRRVDVAWLRRQLFADTAMDVWLDMPPEGAALAVSRK